MTVKEIHDQELTNCDRLYFRKEGMFWKAFDRSAFLLHLLGFDYKASWSSSKALPDGVVRVGTSVHPKELLPDKKVLVDEDKYVVLEAGITLVEANYYEWREKVIEGTTSLLRTPRRTRGIIRAAPAMEEALREAASGAGIGEAPQRGHSAPGTWSDGIIDSLRRFDASGSPMQAFVMLVFSLKEEIARHDREEADTVR